VDPDLRRGSGKSNARGKGAVIHDRTSLAASGVDPDLRRGYGKEVCSDHNARPAAPALGLNQELEGSARNFFNTPLVLDARHCQAVGYR
jgi:hypothetical protein